VEYLYDGRDRDPSVAPPTPFQKDLFLGTRIALNDAQDSSILAGATTDLDDRSTVWVLEAQTRLSDRWTLAAKGRFLVNVKDDPLLRNFEKDSYAEVSVRWNY